jgi:threonylcarbamoyladenosine tRNA methylthiotransferase MtaB
LIPNACIGVDVIVGFPGETDEEYQKTYDFIHGLDVSYLHVFTYSERPNTTALRIQDVVPKKVREERNKKLRILSHKKKKAFYQSQMSLVKEVLFEAEEEGGYMNGFTENYVKVKTPYNPDLVNTIQSVELTDIDRDGIYKIKILDSVYA